MPVSIPRVMTNGGEGPRGRAGGATGPYYRTAPPIPPAHSTPQWEDKEDELPFLEFNLGPPPELGPNVECFFWEMANKSKED